MVNDVQVLEHLGNSDQNILVWNLICGVGLTKIKKNWQGSITRQSIYQCENGLKSWLEKESGDLAVEEMWQKFCVIGNQVIDLFVTLGHRKNKKELCWWLNQQVLLWRINLNVEKVWGDFKLYRFSWIQDGLDRIKLLRNSWRQIELLGNRQLPFQREHFPSACKNNNIDEQFT